MPKLTTYRISGVVEVDIKAATPEEAIKIAEGRILDVFDRYAKRLRANCGMDGATDLDGNYLI